MRLRIILATLLAVLFCAPAYAEVVNIDGHDVSVEEIANKMIEARDGSIIFRTEDSKTGIVWPDGTVRFLELEDKISTKSGRTEIIVLKRPFALAAMPPKYKLMKLHAAAIYPRSLCRDHVLARLPGLCPIGKMHVRPERCIKTQTDETFICLKREIDG